MYMRATLITISRSYINGVDWLGIAEGKLITDKGEPLLSLYTYCSNTTTLIYLHSLT